MEILPAEEVYSRNAMGLTAVEVAIEVNNAEGLRVLIENGMRVDRWDSHSETPLQRAVTGCKASLVKILLTARARIPPKLASKLEEEERRKCVPG